jgi:hypothetical protein
MVRVLRTSPGDGFAEHEVGDLAQLIVGERGQLDCGRFGLSGHGESPLVVARGPRRPARMSERLTLTVRAGSFAGADGVGRFAEGGD